MKKLLSVGLIGLVVAGPAVARDTVVMVPLKDILEMPEAKGRLDDNFRFYLQGQATPAVISRFGSDVSNRKTNGANKSDLVGCKWAALSALLAFQQSGRGAGANAIIDIVSYYKKHEVSNATAIECHAGAVVVGVALKGTYAKVAK